MQTPQPLSRRTVTAGLAWSVPAVAAVTAAPAFAASPVCATATSGDVTKYPGNSSSTGLRQAYGFPVTVTNTTQNVVRVSPGAVRVEFSKKTATGRVVLYSADPCKGGVALDNKSAQLELDPGASVDLFLVADQTGNSANDSGCIHATLMVRLANSSAKPVGDLCKHVDVSQACFASTPPLGC